MKQLLEGAISESFTLKDLLTDILQAQTSGVSVLQFFIDDESQYGEIIFFGGHYIVGANLSEGNILPDEVFYHLLQLKEAKFHYFLSDSLDAIPANTPLRIDLKEVLDNWQIVSPVSHNNMLDKIFKNVEPIPEIKAVATLPAEEALNPEEAESVTRSYSQFADKPSHLDWELVNPLLVGGAPGNKGISSIGHEWEEQASTAQGLRALSAGKEWQKNARRLIFVILFFIIAVLVYLGVKTCIVKPQFAQEISKPPAAETDHKTKRNKVQTHTSHHRHNDTK